MTLSSLQKALNGADDVDEALERWSAKETELGRRLLSVGERLEQLLIWRVPDFAAMDADSLRDPDVSARSSYGR